MKITSATQPMSGSAQRRLRSRESRASCEQRSFDQGGITLVAVPQSIEWALIYRFYFPTRNPQPVRWKAAAAQGHVNFRIIALAAKDGVNVVPNPRATPVLHLVKRVKRDGMGLARKAI